MKILIKDNLAKAKSDLKEVETIEVIPEGYSKKLEDDKGLRIDNQYYLKNRPVQINN